jgi:Zn-finger nucleic acid-binding protein
MSHEAVSARTGEPMRCPTCGTRLVEVERTGVLIDACPNCRGVWLDRGELDKILVKERQLSGGDPDEDFFREVEGGRAPRPHAPPHEPYREERDYGHHGHRKRRKRSFLEDLLDFE